MNTSELVEAVYKAMKRHRRVRRNGKPRLEFGACPDDEMCSDEELGRGATSRILRCERGAKKKFTQQQYYEREKKEFQDLALVDPAFDYFVRPICFNDAQHFIIMERLTVDMKSVEDSNELTVEKFHEVILRTALGIQLLHTFYVDETRKSYTDLKEPNIMFNEQGLSKIVDVGSIYTSSQREVGVMLTTGYNDPFGNKPTDRLVWEVFSLGIIIYKYFCDEHPFNMGGKNEIMRELVSAFRLQSNYRAQIYKYILANKRLPQDVKPLLVGMLQPPEERMTIDEFIAGWRMYRPGQVETPVRRESMVSRKSSSNIASDLDSTEERKLRRKKKDKEMGIIDVWAW